MALELYYTSSPRGLRPGASGLCTVAMTRTMSAALASRLESLCGYRPPSEETPIEQWPAALSHWIVDVGGVERHVLASVRPVRPDHTMRSNTLAHFAVLHASELDPAGAAWMIAQPETSATAWSGEPRMLDAERAMPKGGPAGARRCTTWQSTAGDAGWAGVLANAAMLDPSKPMTVIYPKGTRVLDLVLEAMSLVPAEHRWRVTFTTYFTQPIAGLRCTWRFCLDGTSAATAARQGGGLVIDACVPQPCTRTGAFVDAARSGRGPALASVGEHGQARSRATHPASSGAGNAAAIDAGMPGPGLGPGPHVPRRMPVGMDEAPGQETSGGRTALAATVVAAVVLLAVVAVMGVIMRSMGLQSADLESRLRQAQERMSGLEASSTEAEGLRADVDRLHSELGAANARRQELEAELDALRRQSAEPGQGDPEPPRAAPVRPAPNGSDAEQPGDASAPRADGTTGPAAATMPAGAMLRQRVTSSDANGPAATVARDDGIVHVMPPGIDGLNESRVELSWPDARRCGIRALAVSPSAALEKCGFSAMNGSVLCIGASGRGSVEVARVDVGESGPRWTWLKGSAPQIGDSISKAGMRLPEDWPVILGQLTLVATCADSQTRVAVAAPPKMERWPLGAKGSPRFEGKMPDAIVVQPVVEWAGSSVEVAGNRQDAVLPGGAMGSIAARIDHQEESKSSCVMLDWIPSSAEVEVRECISQLTTDIANERALHAVWVTASRMLGIDATQPGAGQPTAAARAEAQRRFDAWSAQRRRQLTTATQRAEFDGTPLDSKLKEFRSWLLDSELTPMRALLAERKATCDRLRAEWSATVEGTQARIRPERDSPPLVVVTLAIGHTVPELPDFSEAPPQRGGR